MKEKSAKEMKAHNNSFFQERQKIRKEKNNK